jgi:hypothetical protein
MLLTARIFPGILLQYFTMVNFQKATAVNFMAFILIALPVAGQDDIRREQRLAEIERKLTILDPSFQPQKNADLDQRLQAAEHVLDALLAARTVPERSTAATPVVKPPNAPAQPATPLQPLAISGDYQTSEDAEAKLPVSGYMEAHFNKPNGQPGIGDFHRFVLLFGHSFSDRIKFWSELELEHALVEGGEERGELALEQAYLDFLITSRFNFRAGMVLTPVGIVNERHEPPAFNGVERPFVETFIIPTTWRELGMGFTGDLGRGFRYRTYMLSALNPLGFNAETGIAEGRRSGFNSSFRNPAFVGRLEYSGIRRLTLGLSAYSGIASAPELLVTPRVSLGNVDGRYSFRRFDFRALFANTWVSRTAELNHALERRFGSQPNVARIMRGYYFEPAFHILPRRMRNDISLFARYEKYNTQHEMAPGFVPLPEFDRRSVVTGITYKPHTDVAIKFDYVFNRNASSVVRPVDGLNLGFGWWF